MPFVRIGYMIVKFLRLIRLACVSPTFAANGVVSLTEGRDGWIRPRSLWALDQWHDGATFRMRRVLQLAEVQ